MVILGAIIENNFWTVKFNDDFTRCCEYQWWLHVPWNRRAAKSLWSCIQKGFQRSENRKLFLTILRGWGFGGGRMDAENCRGVTHILLLNQNLSGGMCVSIQIFFVFPANWKIRCHASNQTYFDQFFSWKWRRTGFCMWSQQAGLREKQFWSFQLFS